MQTNVDTPYEIWRKRKAAQVTGLSHQTLMRRVANGQFPPPISLGGRSIGWRSTDVMAWLDARTAEAGYGMEGAK